MCVPGRYRVAALDVNAGLARVHDVAGRGLAGWTAPPTGLCWLTMAAGEYRPSIYRPRAPDEVGWYEPDPVVSRRLVSAAYERGARSVIRCSLAAHRGSWITCSTWGSRGSQLLDVPTRGLTSRGAAWADRARPSQWIVGDVTTIVDVGVCDILARPCRLPAS